MTKPFLIRHADGREYELAGDKAGIALYREQYQHQGFAVVDPQPHTHERPDLSEKKATDGASKRGTTDADAGAGDSKPGPAVQPADGDAGGK